MGLPAVEASFRKLTAASHGHVPFPHEGDRWLAALRRFGYQLLRHARDTYGPTHTPLFVCQLDIDAKRLPRSDSTLYAPANRGGAGPRMNNLQFDFGLVRFLDALSRVTGNSQYSDAVTEYLSYYFAELPDEGPERARGLWPWGDHRGYDVVRDEIIGGAHEFKRDWPPWGRFWQVDSKAVRREIEGLARHIYDRSKSWGFSRHFPSGHTYTHSMPSSGGAYVAAWAFLYEKTGEGKYLEWAEGLRDYFWRIRDQDTDLLAAHPADPAYPANMQHHRMSLRALRTEYMGQLIDFGPLLLRTAEVLGPEEGPEFRRQGLAYIRSFATRMDIQADGSFYATFDLDTGAPLFARVKPSQGWTFVPQMSEKYNWGNRVLPLRAPITLAFSYKMTGADDLRRYFDRLQPLFDLEYFADPTAERRDIPAGLMAQAITAFMNMYQGSGEISYLEKAHILARYAMQHYYVSGWFVCGPSPLARYKAPGLNTWRLYSNRGGSPNLALSLLRLHLVSAGEDDFVDDNPMCYW